MSTPAARRASSPIVVRQATPDDLPTVVALRLSLLREHSTHPIYGRLRGDAAHRARDLFAAQLDSPSEVMFLAERGGQVVGILRCVESTGSPLLHPARYGYVSSVFVTPTARRAGVLRALIDRAVAWCEDRGLGEMRLHSVAGDAVSEAAWDALGFEVVEYVRLRRIGLG
ncbi:MAG: GNAT family N-acetyltransferase [Gemmatimonadota bacterium]|nr:GNAT family N-acetyltransferase [Gemmatimonadota bacterium]